MLKELPCVRQDDSGFRRWFNDDYFDLIVWYEDDRQTTKGFQLCYDVGGREHCLTWLREKGFSHNRMDGGTGIWNRTPILQPDGSFPGAEISERFACEAATIESAVAGMVRDKLEEYRRQIEKEAQP